MSDREPEDDERDDQDDEEDEESPPPPTAKSKAKAKAASASRSRAPAVEKNGAVKPSLVPAKTAIAIGIAALALGGIAGWFGQIEKSKAALRAEAAAAPAGSGAAAGPCGAWQSKICLSAGDLSASCQQARGAAELLLSSTCQVALTSMPETLAKIKAARASCDKLVGKLCQDLPPGSKTCDMVKQRTPSFPRERCDQMLQSYDKVIAELKQMDAQGGMPMGAPPMSNPQRTMPGVMPHVIMPPAATSH